MTTRNGTPARWSWSTGERGVNRVRVFTHPKSGRLCLKWTETGLDGRRVVRTESLGHMLEAPAKQAAIAKAAELAQRGRRGTALTLGTLFDMYEREQSPKKSAGEHAHDRSALDRFRVFFGVGCDPMALAKREWDAYIYARERGRIQVQPRPGHRARALAPVRNRAIEHDLKLLKAVLRWAKLSRLIPDTPFDGFTPPAEKSPRRPVLTVEQYEALCKVAGQVDLLMPLALVLAHETGHRISAIRQLRWSDVDFAAGLIRWREEHDKIGFEHVTPLSAAARAILEQVRDILGGGRGWLFPSRQDPRKPLPRGIFNEWWDEAERLAKLPPVARRGWHALRREFGTSLMHQPLRVVQELGGWKSPKVLLEAYQQPPLEMQRAALEDRREVRTSRGTDSAT